MWRFEVAVTPALFIIRAPSHVLLSPIEQETRTSTPVFRLYFNSQTSRGRCSFNVSTRSAVKPALTSSLAFFFSDTHLTHFYTINLCPSKMCLPLLYSQQGGMSEKALSPPVIFAKQQLINTLLFYYTVCSTQPACVKEAGLMLCISLSLRCQGQTRHSPSPM